MSIVLHVRCPKTGRSIEAGQINDSEGLAACWDEPIRVRCPHCGADHDTKVREAFVMGQISELSLRGV